jgi:hypothetical protein
MFQGNDECCYFFFYDDDFGRSGGMGTAASI